MKGWNVYLFDEMIDTVYFSAGASAQYVYDTLVDSGEFHPNIILKPA